MNSTKEFKKRFNEILDQAINAGKTTVPYNVRPKLAQAMAGIQSADMTLLLFGELAPEIESELTNNLNELDTEIKLYLAS